MENNCYLKLRKFLNKFPGGIHWRDRKHCEIIDKHLNPDEQIEFVCIGQLNNEVWGWFDTAVLALTNKRIMIGHKSLVYGYKFISITPDMYNDLTIRAGLIWGTVVLDTVKETVYLSNITKKALAEIETHITMFMGEAKKLYPQRQPEKKV